MSQDRPDYAQQVQDKVRAAARAQSRKALAAAIAAWPEAVELGHVKVDHADRASGQTLGGTTTKADRALLQAAGWVWVMGSQGWWWAP